MKSARAMCDYCDGQGCHHCDPPKAPCCNDHDYYLKRIRKLMVLLRTQNDYLGFVESCLPVQPPIITHTQRGDSISVSFQEINSEIDKLAKEEADEKARRERERQQKIEKLKYQRDKLTSDIEAAERAGKEKV